MKHNRGAFAHNESGQADRLRECGRPRLVCSSARQLVSPAPKRAYVTARVRDFALKKREIFCANWTIRYVFMKKTLEYILSKWTCNSGS